MNNRLLTILGSSVVLLSVAQSAFADYYCDVVLKDEDSRAVKYFRGKDSYSSYYACREAERECRYAKFEEETCSQYQYGQFGKIERSTRIRCSSEDHKRKTCSVDGKILHIDVSKVYSNTDCIQGDTWDHTESFIWVSKGCRARFSVDYVQRKFLPPLPRADGRRPAPKPKPGREIVSTSILCQSKDLQRRTCYVGGKIIDAIFNTKWSNSPCIEGVSYGFYEQSIWVDQGCRGTFRVRYLKKH